MLQNNFFSIIICTYNRSCDLKKTLLSYASFKENIPHELLVVDNNSRDDTSLICEEFINTYPQVKYIFEPTPGLSHARNTGIKEAQGNIIAFVDDDVNFLPYWFNNILKPFITDPTVMAVGGQSFPVFEGGNPDWITNEMLKIYGSTLSGDTEKQMFFPEHPFGLNMAIRKSVFKQIGLFNTALGRKKNSLLSNEESDLFHRIDQHKMKVQYTPHAKLEHRIPKERVSKKWVLKRYFWGGISEIIEETSNLKPARIKYLSHLYSEFMMIKKIIFADLTFSPKKLYWHINTLSFYQKALVAEHIGKMRQLLVQLLSF
ncbi:glycosyltransferase family 2 protein [Methylomarinum vadi]|uniref:glycosyltransferase family 2 protein n=1 Tax=Methylomarinum vadi TaxID=438855 RepID=UPI0006902A28|nr:glycosyltransferase family 2 protein [Methylomarinum vadi]